MLQQIQDFPVNKHNFFYINGVTANITTVARGLFWVYELPGIFDSGSSKQKERNYIWRSGREIQPSIRKLFKE